MQIWQIVLIIVIVLAIVIGNLALLRLGAKTEFKPSTPHACTKKREKNPE